MTVELATYLDELASANPGSTDVIPEGDDHIRLIKAVIKATFPGRGGEDNRALAKTASFTPALTEVGVVFVCTATLVVTLPALAGLPEGTYYTFVAKTGTITLTPNGVDTIDSTSTFVLAAGQTCTIVKLETDWVVLIANAKTLGGYDSSAFVRSVNGVTPTAGNVNVAVPTWSTLVGKPTGPTFTATWNVVNKPGTPTHLWGYTVTSTEMFLWNPADFHVSYANSANYATAAGTATYLAGGYNHTNLPYAPTTAFVNVTSSLNYFTGYIDLTFTRANGATVVVSAGL